MEPDVQSASRRTGDSGRPRESLEQRVRELPASKIQQMMANAGVITEDLHGGPRAKGWGFASVDRSELNFPGEFIDALKSDRWFHCPDSLDGMSEAFGVTCQVERLRGSTLYPLPTKEQAQRIKRLSEELQKESKNTWATEAVMKGIALAKLGEYSKARAFYDQALSLNPSSVDALVAKGASYANQSRFQEAVSNFEKALEIDPQHANASEYLQVTRQKIPHRRPKGGAQQGSDPAPSSSAASPSAETQQEAPAPQKAILKAHGLQSGKFKEELEEAFAAVKRKMAKKERKSVGDERRSKKEKHRHKKRKSLKKKRRKSEAKKRRGRSTSSSRSRSPSSSPSNSQPD